MSSKSNLNPIKRILTLVLAVVMVFSVNLTSMTAHVAMAKPTTQTEQDKPSEIKRLQIGGNAASIYKDDNGDQLYMSGWMYTDNPDESIAPENWYTAPIGAADYTMSTTSKIAWFFGVDYTTHPWQ